MPRLLLGGAGLLLGLPFPGAAWATTPAPSNMGDSADYLARHQDEVLAILSQNSTRLLQMSLTGLVALATQLVLVTALIGWLIDLPLGWGFSTIFSPAYAKLKRAAVYTTGRLVLALLFTVVIMFLAMLGLKAGAGSPTLLLVPLVTVLAVTLQVCWVDYQYRTGPGTSLVFYGVLLLVHSLILGILVPTLFAVPLSGALAQAMNQAVVPELQVRGGQAQKAAAVAEAARDDLKSQVAQLQSRLAQDQADEQSLTNKIAAGKDSPALQFSRLVLLRVQGDLADAGKGLADFIRRHPTDPLADSARGQLNGVNEALAAQLALERREQAAAGAAASAGRTQLLAHISAGQATLSELRRVLIGRSRAEVSGLLGPPTATEADRWGYGRRMILDPDTNQTHGLTVVFSEGLVQGVDYFYGGEQ